jgi:type IV pilus assembly protein PilB
VATDKKAVETAAPEPGQNTQSFGGKLFEILIRKKIIQMDMLAAADEEAKRENLRLEKYLVDKKIVSGVDMTLALSEYLEMPPISLAHFKLNDVLLELVPLPTLTKHQIVPLARVGKNLTVALADPFDIFALDELHVLTGMDITPLVAAEKEVRDVLDRSRTDGAKSLDMEDIMKDSDGEVEIGSQEEAEKQSLEEMMDSAEDAPVIKMVNMILIESLRLRANDIHIEPQEDYLRLRYRVDGILVERPHMPKAMQSAVISRVKIMADLDIGESRIPQDGRFRITALGKKIDVRVSILPTIFGGKVVMRTLDKSALFPNLAALGLDEKAYQAMSYAIAQPHGIILVTGPTGSGKTTTLYSCLQELNKPDVNIVTCEDPVEYQLAGINQVRIHTDVGLTFSAALRSILRQDPDICLIGEIRDAETCEIAIKAALTGHLVLSTLHTNDAAGAITRLIDIGIEPFLIASSLILSQAQRLYRKLCQVCKKEAEPDLEVMKEYGVPLDTFKGVKIYTAQGCPKCHGIGYFGRGSIMEVLPIDDDIRTAILKQAIGSELRQIGISRGMTTLMEASLARVKEGSTSLETAVRVAGGGEE